MSEDEKMLGSSAHPLGFPARTQRHKREEVRNKKYRRLFTPRRARTHAHRHTLLAKSTGAVQPLPVVSLTPQTERATLLRQEKD